MREKKVVMVRRLGPKRSVGVFAFLDHFLFDQVLPVVVHWSPVGLLYRTKIVFHNFAVPVFDCFQCLEIIFGGDGKRILENNPIDRLVAGASGQ